MRLRQLLMALFLLAVTWQGATAKPRNHTVHGDPPPVERVVAGATAESNFVLSDVMEVKPEMPLGPNDVLKAYEVAMGLVVDKASADFSTIAQAQGADQISREDADYLLHERYQLATMQFQVLSALHDVLKHEIDEKTEQSKRSIRNANAESVLVLPGPASPVESK